jgi:hypothetical protein
MKCVLRASRSQFGNDQRRLPFLAQGQGCRELGPFRVIHLAGLNLGELPDDLVIAAIQEGLDRETLRGTLGVLPIDVFSKWPK